MKATPRTGRGPGAGAALDRGTGPTFAGHHGDGVVATAGGGPHAAVNARRMISCANFASSASRAGGGCRTCLVASLGCRGDDPSTRPDAWTTSSAESARWGRRGAEAEEKVP